MGARRKALCKKTRFHYGLVRISPQWKDFLHEGDESYVVLGCMDMSVAFAVPLTALEGVLPD